MNNQETLSAERGEDSVQRLVSQPIRIEQPSSINGRKWFFARGYAGGFGAEYGVTLDKRTVAARCSKKAGDGKLVSIRGGWHWLANSEIRQAGPDTHDKQQQPFI